MSLEKKYMELNKMAKNVEDALYKIFIEYLEGDKPFPYGDLENLVSKYELVYNKLRKKKYSGVNEFLNNFNSNRKDMMANLDAPNRYEVLNLASERVISYLIENASNYIPVDEESKGEISDKLLPIVKNLESYQISSVYKNIKKNAINEGISLDDNSFVLLQQLFVGHIISVLSHNPYNKYSRVRNLWTYEKVCENILNEPVMEKLTADKNRSR